MEDLVGLQWYPWLLNLGGFHFSSNLSIPIPPISVAPKSAQIKTAKGRANLKAYQIAKGSCPKNPGESLVLKFATSKAPSKMDHPTHKNVSDVGNGASDPNIP